MTGKPQKKIICSNFILRHWQKGDLRSLVKNANNFNVWINLKDAFPHPYTIDDAKNWIKIAEVSPQGTLFAIVVDGKAAGGIGIHLQSDVHKYSAEMGYWLGEDYWNRGIISEAVKKVTSYAFETFDINRIFAHVFIWNQSSVRVLEKNNFKLEGRLRDNVFKDGVFTDELVYGLLRNDV
jgi:[ribosomal protein S5]-alanine N-acetyltransferase